MIVVLLLAGLLSLAGTAAAHPLGNFTINRYSGIVLSPGRVEVHYVLDMAEIPTFQEQPSIDTNRDGTVSAEEQRSWADRKGPEILASLSLSVNGSPVPLNVEAAAMRFRSGQAGLPVLYFTATFTGELPSNAGSVHYEDVNYPGRIGWKEITVRSRDGVALSGSPVPAASVSRELLAYPKDLLSSPLDVTSASFSFHPGRATLVREPASSGQTVSGAPVASGGAFADLVGWRLTPLILALSLGLALAFGALHALGPGHGKTITAAYLVGSGARVGQAVAVGAAVALMHTASVLTLGLVVFVLARSFPAEQIYPWLTLATGLVALGLGLGLFLTRLRTRRRGIDPWHGHLHPWDHTVRAEGPIQHHHEDPHVDGRAAPRRKSHFESHFETASHLHVESPGGGVSLLERSEPEPSDGQAQTVVRPVEAAQRPMSTRGLAALAVAGGILPSPTAFVVLTGAISAHRIGYGLALISAFSLGLAGALIGVGLLALRARSMVAARLRGRWAGLVPLASALVIVGFGMFFATRGLVQLG